MAVIKCKMCGGDLILVEGVSTAECEFCGSVQTVPRIDDDRKLTAFGRANRLRTACDFDKAAGIYESIVADFPEEAEAYWGLVLCKYGIEYVDDPATGKKVPTCHRSSFDSVLTDENYEQAVENADLLARRVYREEAKELERIRKGILEVSNTEEPYDIFICYKETDENGDRTLDSVLAQDLYSALTDKGYKVFFSRVTLRGRLGVDFEPAIFAALNSAKVMLAVGTSYEHYHAVWVKNEWKRYLKICAADKNKYLIPCYRDMDPEDMPGEFNHLQGADLSKMGAIQDIIFNMEKYIPRQKQTTTVIQQAAPNNTTPLLKRGNMALEDMEWASAEKFFEDVLNLDAECAEAYVGKALAQARCKSLMSMVRTEVAKAKNSVTSERLAVDENKAHIREFAEAHQVPGFLEASEIRNLYKFDLYYTSYENPWRRKEQEILNNWKSNRNLSRASQFASGDTADSLTDAYAKLNDMLHVRVQEAEKDSASALEAVEKKYVDFLACVDEDVVQKEAYAKEERTAVYQSLEQIANESTDVQELERAAKELERMKGYLDSKSLEMLCNDRIKEIYAKKEQARRDAAESKAKALKEEKALRAQQEKENRQNELRKTLTDWEANLVRLRKDQKRFRFYQTIYRLNIFSLIFIFFSPQIPVADTWLETPMLILFGIAVISLIPCALVATIIWWKIWFRYRKFRTGNFVKKQFGNRMKFMRVYLQNAIDEAERTIEAIRSDLNS